MNVWYKHLPPILTMTDGKPRMTCPGATLVTDDSAQLFAWSLCRETDEWSNREGLVRALRRWRANNGNSSPLSQDGRRHDRILHTIRQARHFVATDLGLAAADWTETPAVLPRSPKPETWDVTFYLANGTKLTFAEATLSSGNFESVSDAKVNGVPAEVTLETTRSETDLRPVKPSYQTRFNQERTARLAAEKKLRFAEQSLDEATDESTRLLARAIAAEEKLEAVTRDRDITQKALVSMKSQRNDWVAQAMKE